MNNSDNSMPAPTVTTVQPVRKRKSNAYLDGQEPHRPEVVKTVKKKKCKCKLTSLVEYLDSIKHQNFTGYIKVNFSQGSIGRIERFEEILRK